MGVVKKHGVNFLLLFIIVLIGFAGPGIINIIRGPPEEPLTYPALSTPIPMPTIVEAYEVPELPNYTDIDVYKYRWENESMVSVE